MYVCGFLNLVHKQSLRVLAWGSQPLVWEPLGGDISSRRQRGCLNAGERGLRSLTTYLSIRKMGQATAKTTRRDVHSAHSGFPQRLPPR